MIKILYIEDHPGEQENLAQLLASKGLQVAVASDGFEGVELARSWIPDLILIDLILMGHHTPQIDGFKAIEILRSEQGTSNIPIFACAPPIHDNYREHAFAAGANEFFSKPIELHCLLEKIGSYFKTFSNSQLEQNVSVSSQQVQSTKSTRISKILHVEDNPAQRDILAQMLELNGYEVVTASDGLEGVEKARSWLPDLILMDLRMPGMDGFEAIRIIRSEDRTASIPIFAMSAWASAKHKERALAAGANEHFTKPVDLNRVLSTINRYSEPQLDKCLEKSKTPEQEISSTKPKSLDPTFSTTGIDKNVSPTNTELTTPPKSNPKEKNEIAQTTSTDGKQLAALSGAISDRVSESKPAAPERVIGLQTPARKIIRRTSKKARGSLSFSGLRWLHSSLATINRLAFYVYLVTLPFDVQISLPFLSGNSFQLSHGCLLAILMLWLPTKLIEPHRRWLWGWWYALIPLGMLIYLHSPQSVTELLPFVVLYWFIINELSESVYWEVGLAFIMMVFTQIATTQGWITSIKLLTPQNVPQLVAVEAFVPLGIALSGKTWLSRIAGLLLVSPVIAAAMYTFSTPTIGLFATISVMLVAWLVGRRRMRPQLILFAATLAGGILIDFMANVFYPLEISDKIDALNSWQAYSWIILFMMVLPPVAAVARKSLGIITPLLFISLLIVLYITYYESFNSIDTLALWLGISIVAAIIPLSVVSIPEIKNKDETPTIQMWLIFSALSIILGLPFVIVYLQNEDTKTWQKLVILSIIIGVLVVIVIYPLQSLMIFIFILVSWVLGLAAALSLGADLNIGTGGLMILVSVIVFSLAYVAQSSHMARQLWPVIVATLVAIGTWRSQRIWTVALSTSLIGACILAVINPDIWLAVPQSIFLIVLMGLWVDKGNIPLGIKSSIFS